MKITFFGSSHGIPEPNRKCSCTLVEVGPNRYFIDMGTMAEEQLISRAIPPESVKSIFITHMHGDHTGGLPSFLCLCCWAFKRADPEVYLPADVEATVSAISGWLMCNGVTLRPFRFGKVFEGVIFDDGALKVTAFKTKHIADSYAFLLEAEGKRVLFTGDLCHGNPAADFPVSVLEAPLDLAVCEAAHFEATAYLPIFKGNKNLKRLCFNHYSDRFLPSVLAMRGLLDGVFVFRAHDGLEFFV